MLRGEHGIARHDFSTMVVRPDRLRRGADSAWLPAAADAIEIYRQGIGSTRQVLHERVADGLEGLPGCVPRRIAAFCKLLDDASDYHTAAGDAAALRRRVFSLAADLHPIVATREGIFEHTIEHAQKKIADEIGLPFEQIADEMFADVIELQRLRDFDANLDATRLLSRYNVGQTQALLYKATSMKIDFSDHAAFIVRRAKLAGLMHRITRMDHRGTPSYSMILDGPGSILHGTSRYGIRFAQLIPSLLCCDGWKLNARVLVTSGNDRRRVMRFELSPDEGLRGDKDAPDEFDSQLERDIEQRWRDAPVDGWTMARDREFLTLGQQVYTPDFVLHHQPTARRIFVEVLGFWTPEYLQDKQERLQKFAAATPGSGWLLMLGKKPAPAKQQMLDELSLPVIVFGKRSRPTDWIEAVRSS